MVGVSTVFRTRNLAQLNEELERLSDPITIRLSFYMNCTMNGIGMTGLINEYRLF